MTLGEEKRKAIISKFKSLIRSGMDYEAYSMYKEAGMAGFVSTKQAQRIINKHYHGVLTDAMVEFEKNTPGTMSQKAELFANEFCVCIREARLLLIYAKKKLKRDEQQEN